MQNFERDGMKIRLFKNKVLKLTKGDVARVYKLPNGKKIVDLKSVKKEDCDKLRVEFGLKKSIKSTKTQVKQFEAAMDNIEDDNLWVKAGILFFIF
ncbi:hypothetical protein LIER_17758 [Lithospermum erythrorhizon]|uniref:Uncharacterized protein n=1 Tax=Lithospermum erythrorhizon TaxID=34254 RepID=A0AAV3QE08_LITER